MKFRCNYNLWVLTLVFSTWNSLLGQNEVFTKDTVKNVPKVLILHSRYKDNKERNQLVYNETENIVYDRLKKNLDKLDIQKVEGNNKQFVHHNKSKLIEITDTKQNLREFSKQVEIIVLLESINKTANAESSELLITSFNGCNKIKLTENRIQYKIKNNWIKNDLQYEKLDSILQYFLFNSLLENSLAVKKGKELNCLIEFNKQDTSQPNFFDLKKQDLQDTIENWMLINSIDNQYELVYNTINKLQINGIRMPLFNYQNGVCLDESVFFDSMIKLIPNSELILQNLPSGINAIIRVNH